ncbi:hypothetical protein GF351_01605 [Candidatus Woesearchaeota archaeon]|nr:hypothetical protein [Candidatus Woesearchaeota archaeon]
MRFIGGMFLGAVVLLQVMLAGCEPVDEIIYVDNPVPPVAGRAVKEAETQPEPQEHEITDTQDTTSITGGTTTTGGTIYEKDKKPINVSGSQMHTVVMDDLKFDPEELTIKVHDTVRWVNDEDPDQRPVHRHRLSAHYNEFRSLDIMPGESFEHTFTKPGEYTYIDVIYPSRMRGKIIVE